MELLELIASARSVEGRSFDQLNVPFNSIGQMLSERAGRSPEKTWIVFYDEDGSRSELTYAAFERRVKCLAAALRRRGLGKGDRIATAGYNHLDTVVQYFATWWIGGTVVPLNMGEDDDRLSYILMNSGARLAFVRAEYLDRIRTIAPSTPELCDVIACGDYDGDLPHVELIVQSEIPDLKPELQMLADECLIVYTSGTTGHPKGVVLAQGNLLADAFGICHWHRVSEDSRMMCVLPIHHVNGTVVTIVAPMLAGSSTVLNRKFQSTTFFERIARERVEIVSVVPTLLAFLVQADIDTRQYDLGRFRHIICGAGALTCELAERFENRYDIPIIHGYGLSETTCYSCFLPIDLGRDERRRWLTAYGFPSIGVPIPQNEMSIHDPNGRALPAGERGEIVIRGHNVMIEYYRNLEANRSAFAHGWFRSGDEGFWKEGSDGQSYFFITGRIKELIIRGGVNISPLEIDEVLNSYPGVEAAVAVGFENNWYGEEVGAYVRPVDSSVSAEEILAHCRQHLPFFKSPKVVVFGDDIPVTSTGKYQRNRVRPLFDAWRDTQFHAPDPGKM